jgi:hypothetical protein
MEKVPLVMGDGQSPTNGDQFDMLRAELRTGFGMPERNAKASSIWQIGRMFRNPQRRRTEDDQWQEGLMVRSQ